MKRLRIEGIPSPFAWFYSILISKSKIIKEIYSEIAEKVASRITSGIVLDVGTGPGFLPIEIAKRSPEIEVIGIDISEGMVKLAIRNSEEAGYSEQLKFLKASASSIPFENEYFDLVLSTFSFHHWAEPEKCFGEIGRVLRNGGEAWIYDIRRDTSEETNAQIKRKYGILIYILLQFVKIHSSLTIGKIEGIPYNEIGFSRRSIEDIGIILKIRFVK